MTQALNYTTKAIADLTILARDMPDGNRQGLEFLISLLMRAEIFLLPDNGELLDRSKVRPEVPGDVFRPPFPVVALEYAAVARGALHPMYEAELSSRRIALAWEWDGRQPSFVSGMTPEAGTGVMVASICFWDSLQLWLPIWAAVLLPFEEAYVEQPNDRFLSEMVKVGRVSPRQAAAKGVQIGGLLPLLPEAMEQAVLEHGSDAIFESLHADLMDEVNAYTDLCLALACNNVGTERHAQPAALNKARIRRGVLPLKDFHLLKIAGASEGGGFGGSANGGVRSHLRRGHIRRLGADRITWVNACMVNGSRRGFIDKAYSIAGGAR